MITETLDQRLTEVRPLPIRYTVDDLEFMPDDGRRRELIKGELFVSRAPHFNHQLLITNLIYAFRHYLDSNPIGEIVTTPGVIFSKDDAAIPDVVFSTHETIKKNVAGEGEKYDGKFIAAPDLVIEILSFGRQDVERDRIHKRQLYGEYKVKEYWIVNARFLSIEIYRLQDNGLEMVRTAKIEETIESPLLPGFSLLGTDVFRF